MITITEIVLLILVFLSVYFFIGFSQIASAYRIKRKANQRRFPKKDFFVSVIIPIKEATRTTMQSLQSVCNQNYPKFEVLFIAEVKEHGAYKIAQALRDKYRNTKVLLSGRHDPSKSIAKCHSLIYGSKHAKGEVLLFGDSDVSYSHDWIRKMTLPLNENVNGRHIDCATAPFFIEPEGFFGKFITLSISLVTFTASFTKEEQMFPSYASGASIAISREVFEELKVREAWAGAYNDDLVLADRVIDSGRNIYNQLANPNHPNEAFLNNRQIVEKLIRWVVTISTFGHRNLKNRVPSMLVRNLQFQVALVLGISIFFMGYPWLIGVGIIVVGYIYLVVFRWWMGQIIEEKGMTLYYLLAPVSITAMMVFYVFVRLFFRNFSWEGENYTVN